MRIYNSKLWISDLDETINVLPELDELADNSVMITGCTGLICSAIVDILIRWNEVHDKKIQILAAGRNKNKIIERFYPYSKKNWFVFVPYDAVSEKKLLKIKCTYIIHGACNASPNIIIKEPVETMLSNFLGIKNLLDRKSVV